MTTNGKRQVSVGQAAKHRGSDVEITSVASDGENVKVSYPYAHKNPAWVKVEDLVFLADSFVVPDMSPNGGDLYPVGTLLTNAAGETVKVVGRWKTDVKLQAMSPLNPPAAQGEGNRSEE